MNHNQIAKILVACGLLGLGCANDPVTFSQSEGIRRIEINVESTNSDDATAAGGVNGTNVEPATPAITAGEEKVRTLLDGFEASDDDDFDPEQYFDVAAGDDPETKHDLVDNVEGEDSVQTSTEIAKNNADEDKDKSPTEADSADDATEESTPPSSTPPSSTASDDKDGDTEPATKAEVKLCAKLAGVDPQKVILGQPKTLSSGSVLALKINGSKHDVELNLVGDATAALQGVCIFMAGNQGKIAAKIGLKVENLLFVGRGNQGQADFTVDGNGSISAAVVSLAGNKNKVNFKSNGKPTCAEIFVFAKKGGFQCE